MHVGIGVRGLEHPVGVDEHVGVEGFVQHVIAVGRGNVPVFLKHFKYLFLAH